jgi:hypothetical protein
MLKRRGGGCTQDFILQATPVVAVSVFSSIVLAFCFLQETEFSLFDDANSPESMARRIAVGLVMFSNTASALAVGFVLIRRNPSAHFAKDSRKALLILSLTTLFSLGAAFAALDMTFSVADRTKISLTVLVLGLVAAGPMLVASSERLGSLCKGILAYGIFAAWIIIQREIDWNMRDHFLRAYSRIHQGMTIAEVDDVIRREFHGRRPVARLDASGLQYTLDPKDGRYDSECIIIGVRDGKVEFAHYSSD